MVQGRLMAKSKKSKAIERLQRQLGEITALKQQRYDSPSFIKWRRDTTTAIRYTFGEASNEKKEFEGIRYTAIMARDDNFQQRSFEDGLDRASSILASMIDEIDEYWEDEDQVSELPQTSPVTAPSDLKKVFIVHGRDHGTRDSVARFINDLGLEPVIMQEQPNEGLTIIEKFEKYAEVGFAVVLFTPDDIGAYKGDEDEFRLRARQNVIFELGYLVSHLGRGRVVVLYKGSEGDIEIPSDYAGVLYTPMDDGGGWRFPLIGELKSADLEVDANRAFQT